MPTQLYIRGNHRIELVRQNDFYYINNNTAFETLYRLNLGGNSVASTYDTRMYHVWDSDDEFVVGFGYQTPHFNDANITDTSETPAYSAPRIVYTTTRTMANCSKSLHWEFPLNFDFYYLFRLHFCEIQPEVKGVNHRFFDIYIGNQMAERAAKVVEWSGGWRFPIYRDYVVNMTDLDDRRNKQNITLELSPNMKTKVVYANVTLESAYSNAILNGLEIFKLGDAIKSLEFMNCPQKQTEIRPP